jgi:hypothetical protein
MRRQVQVDIERQQDVRAEQPVGPGATACIGDTELSDSDPIDREVRASEHQAVRQQRVEARRRPANSDGAGRAPGVAWQLQALHRVLGQQRAFGTAIYQQPHRLVVDGAIDEQHVVLDRQRHLGDPDQGADPGGVRPVRIGGASCHPEQQQKHDKRAGHGVARTCTVARTAAPSASSTVRR